MWHLKENFTLFSPQTLFKLYQYFKVFSFPWTILVPKFENMKSKEFYSLFFLLKIMSENCKNIAWETNQNKSTSVISHF